MPMLYDMCSQCISSGSTANKLSICWLSGASRVRLKITCWTILHVLLSQAGALTAS